MIDIKNVSFTYQEGEAESLRNVSLHVNKGECVLLCGKSGCGKTTLTRLLNGLIPNFHEGKLSGDVRIGGINPAESAMYETSKIVGSVFQNPRTQFYTVNTTSEIAFGLENLGLEPDFIAQAVRETAQMLSIEHLLNRNIFSLSGGEKQIIALASVCAMNPDVYVLDEPSSNLDAEAIEMLRQAIAALKAKGKTIVIAEHRVYWLKDLADRILYMEDGEIKQAYTIDELAHLTHDERMATGIRAVDVPKVSVAKVSKNDTTNGISLNGVTMSYGKNTVLDVPHATIPSGKIIAVTGRNGAGKSTFVSGLCGLMKCKGQVSCNGEVQNVQSRLRQSYMVLQEVGHQLFGESVAEEISLGIKNPNTEALDALLEQLDIAAQRERHPHTLSGGQKQRVAIASALFCGKSVLVFDEPTSGLDYAHMQKTAGLLRELLCPDMIILVITHDVEFINAACDCVMCIDGHTIKGQETKNERTVQAMKQKKTKQFSAAGMFTSISVLCGIASVFLAVLMISRLWDGQDFNQLLPIGLLIAACQLAKAGCNALALWKAHDGAYSALLSIRLALIGHMERLPLSFFQKRTSGELAGIIDHDVERIEVFLAHTKPEVNITLSVCALSFIATMIINWRMGLALIAAVPIVILIFVISGPLWKGSIGAYQTSMRAVSESIMEYISTIPIIKVFSQGESRTAKVQSGMEDYIRKAKKAIYVQAAPMGIVMVLAEIGVVLVAIVGANAMQGAPITSAMIVRFVLGVVLAGQFTNNLIKLTTLQYNQQVYNHTMKTVNTILDEPVAEDKKVQTVEGGDIILDHVSFAYDDGENVLNDVSLRFRPGTKSAIVGPSGAGKSTIAGLLLGFWKQQRGAITIGGISVDTISEHALAEYVTVVHQESFLLNMTVAENIRIGKPDATDAEVTDAAQKARIHETIINLPDGYNTVIGEHGARLSGGEKQRISLARMILKDAPVVVLDEATAAVDPYNEALIQQAIAELCGDKTLIVIAHHLRTVEGADQIILLNKGRVEAVGTHAELLKSSGLYAEMIDAENRAKNWSIREVTA